VFLNRFVYLSSVEIIKIFDGKAIDSEKPHMFLRLVAVVNIRKQPVLLHGHPVDQKQNSLVGG
jgi:hypothetical protein